MSLHYEDAKSFAVELAKEYGEVVTVVGETNFSHDDAEAQELVNPDSTSVQGLLEAGVGNCRFVQFPFHCLDTLKLSWKVSFRGIRLDSLNPVNLVKALSTKAHGLYMDPEDPSVFESLDAVKCSCGHIPAVRAVLKDGHVQGQLYCPQCGHEGPAELLEGDAVEAWNESLK